MSWHIDLNADLGEGASTDKELLALVSSANISCGSHAGDEEDIRQALREALRRGVSVGAHPAWPDRTNFGRKAMTMTQRKLAATMQEQLGYLGHLAQSEGVRLCHVKPHGALYNQAARDATLARQLIACFLEFDPSLRVIGPPGSALLQAAQASGMAVISEGFADRAYAPDGSLVSREKPGSLLSIDEAIRQSLQIVRDGVVQTQEGRRPLAVQSLCIHGDTPQALALARALYAALEEAQVLICPQTTRN